MIRKHGFVSNSSTTSFLIYGIALEPEEAKAMMKRDHPKIKASIEKWGDDEPFETLESVFGYVNSYNSDPNRYDTCKYYGLSWGQIRDDETGAQFKERVRAMLAEALDGDLALGTIEEAWYDG
jgi:hypothetical protein